MYLTYLFITGIQMYFILFFQTSEIDDLSMGISVFLKNKKIYKCQILKGSLSGRQVSSCLLPKIHW